MSSSVQTGPEHDVGSGTGRPAPPWQPSPKRVLWLTVGGLLTVAALFFTSVNVVSLLGTHVVNDTHTYAAVGTVDVRSNSGDIRVVRGGDGGITVDRHARWSFSEPHLAQNVSADNLRLDSGCHWWMTRCSVNYTIHVPADTHINIHSSSGDVSVSDVDSDVDVSISSGDVRASNIGGNLSVVSSSGDVRADDVRGRFYVRHSSGDVQAAGLRSRSAEVHASSGDTTLAFAQAPSDVQVKASSGDVHIVVPPHDAYRTSISTSSGDRDVKVVQDPSAQRSIDVDVSSGDTKIDYS